MLLQYWLTSHSRNMEILLKTGIYI